MHNATVLPVWRPVVGFEGLYEVSDDGRVRSIPRDVYSGGSRTRRTRMTILSPCVSDNYPKVSMKVDGFGTTRNVHTLVAEAFIGPRPDGMEVCHNNGDRLDNRVSNLRYDTHSENQKDTVRLGMNFYAKRTHCNYGHKFTLQNTAPRSDSDSGRRCRECQAIRGRRRRGTIVERGLLDAC